MGYIGTQNRPVHWHFWCPTVVVQDVQQTPVSPLVTISRHSTETFEPINPGYLHGWKQWKPMETPKVLHGVNTICPSPKTSPPAIKRHSPRPCQFSWISHSSQSNTSGDITCSIRRVYQKVGLKIGLATWLCHASNQNSFEMPNIAIYNQLLAFTHYSLPCSLLVNIPAYATGVLRTTWAFEDHTL